MDCRDGAHAEAKVPMQDDHTRSPTHSPEASAPTLPDYAAHDPDCVLAPGLFRSLPPGKDARKHRLEVNYVAGKRRIQFLSPDLLGVDDMRALQGLMAVAMGWKDDDWLKLDEPCDQYGEQLALALEPKDAMYNRIALQVRGSFASVARALGLNPDSGRVIAQLRESIRRLAGLTIWVEDEYWEGGCALVSRIAWSKRRGRDGALACALNPQLADIALNGRHGGGKYVRIDMREVRALRGSAARLIHQRLCGWIDAGKSGLVNLDTLCGYVWPENAATKRGMEKRRRTVRRALTELRNLPRPWTAKEYARGKFKISRPGREVSEGPDRVH